VAQLVELLFGEVELEGADLGGYLAGGAHADLLWSVGGGQCGPDLVCLQSHLLAAGFAERLGALQRPGSVDIMGDEQLERGEGIDRKPCVRFTRGARVEFQILGPLEVRDGDREVRLRGGKERALLALLLVNANRTISLDRIVAELWGDDMPETAHKMVQVYVSRLRKLLPSGTLQTRGPGYSLGLDADDVDLHRFERLVAAARASLDAGRAEQASAAFRAALELWRGPALAEFSSEPFAKPDAARLEELRVHALEGRLDADLLLGRHGTLVGELEALIARYPLREGLRRQHMLALYRSGRQAEALAAYRAARRALADELGIEPSSGLRKLERQILHQDPSLDPAAPPPAATLPVPPGGELVTPRRAGLRDGRLPDRLAQAAVAPLVGRAEQLQHLATLLDRTAAGDGALVVIAGEGGIGKTRLVAELADRASGFGVLYGRCDEEVVPFGPWVEALARRLAEIPDDELEATLGGDGRSLARLIPELHGRVPALVADPAGDPEDDRHRLFAAIAAFIERLATREPLLLVLDDLHWADRSSLRLLRRLTGGWPGRVLVVGTYRDNELPKGHYLTEVLADLEREQPAIRINLGGLDASELAALVASWRGLRLPAETIDAIQREAGGNPFLMKQLVRHLEELGDLRPPPPGGSFGVPVGLRDVIARRVARLPTEGGRVLGVAALIGHDFDFDLLRTVVALPEEQLLDVLDAAVQAGIVVEAREAPGRYSFAHALLRTTLEHELTATRRARLHAAIGTAIESRHAASLDGYPLGDLARHFAAAGPEEVDRAVSYSMRASEEAAARLAYDEAADYVATALALRERGSRADERELIRLRLLLAQAIARTGRWERARDAFASAADASRRGGPPELFALAALGHAGGSFERYGMPDRASAALLEEAIDRLPTEDSPLRAQLLARLSDVLYYLAVPAATLHSLSRQAIDIARRLDDAESLARAFTSAQYAYWHPGEYAARLELAHELVAASERLGDPVVEAGACMWRAIGLLDHCRLEEADLDLARHAQLAEELRQPELLLHAAAFRAMRALLEGRWQDGEQAAAEVLGLGERSRAADALQSYGVEMLQLRNEQLRLGELTDHFQRLVDEIAALPGWRSALAWAHVQAGSVDRAREEVDELRRNDFAALPHDANFVPACTILGHIAGELDDADLAAAIEPLLRPSAPYWVVLGYGPATLGPVAFTLGLACQLTGRVDQAVDDFELALEQSSRMRARPYAAHSQVRLAQVLEQRAGPGDAVRASVLRSQGIATARELGMTRLLRDTTRTIPALAG
jgi:DNA-binding SARP family transcriptional activator